MLITITRVCHIYVFADHCVYYILRLHYIIQFLKRRKKEMFYLTTHSTHYIYGYMASDMVKDHSDSERKPAAATWATLSD